MSLVSVIIPSYKRSDKLEIAINSVLNQTYKNIEIIVVDDNEPLSKDRIKTEKIMQQYENNPKVNYLKHSRNMNGSVARNTGIKNSTGKYIALLDNDDEFLKDKIELQVKKLEELGDSYGVVYTKFVRMKNRKIIDRGIENRTGNLTLEILKGTFYISAGSNLLIRREIVEKIGGFNESFLRRQDLEFLIRVSRITKIAHVDKCCLIINKDDRSNMIKGDSIRKNTENYLKLFEDYITEFSEKERNNVIISQYLLLLRTQLFNLKLGEAYKTKKELNISIFLLIRYFFYLLKRKIFKQCYGFKI